MDIIKTYRDIINSFLKNKEPANVIIVSVASTYILYKCWNFYSECEDGIPSTLKKWFFKTIKKIPWVQKKIADELEKTMLDLRKDVNSQLKGLEYHTSLPESGWNRDKIVSEVETLLGLGDYKALSGICHKPEDKTRTEVITHIYTMTAYTNPLNPDAFPGVRKMEAEVVRMTGNLFNGGPDMCGTMTSGGSESLILAVLAYRGYARETRGVTRPNIVIPVTGHVALDKAGHLLGVSVRHVKVDPVSMVPRLSDMRRACDGNTIMLLASAPQYAHGVMDPIADIAALGQSLNIPVHVDACLGGFLIAFAEKIGLQLDPYDFRVPGVTSISADTHKFGYAPKGSSVIMYSSNKYIHHQYYVSTEWTGGIFVSPTLAGSRSGGIIAATWASLMHHGWNGYTQMTRDVIKAANVVRSGIQSIDGLSVLGDSKLCIIAFTSDKFHVYKIADEMKKHGWMLSCIQNPNAVQLYVVPNLLREGVIEQFVSDLRTSAATILENPGDELTGKAAVYGMAQTIPDKSLVSDLAAGFMDIIYSTN